MRRAFQFCWGLAAALDAGAQNLVVNGGFETYSALPTTYSQVCYASGWSSPSGYCSLVVGCGSPEYYNTGSSGGVAPPSTYWATVMPHTGHGMVGFAPWYWTNTTFREYVRGSLTTPLVPGQTYDVGFWLTNGVSTIHPYGIDHIGVAFSTAPLTQSCGAQIAYTPQIEIPGVFYSTTWQYFTFSFTPTAAYSYICFGNFVPWGSTTYQILGASGNSGSYYYLDDVTVQPSVLLPIELIRFDASADGHGGTDLEWVTASEQGNDHFVVERSVDGQLFTAIDEVAGAGDAQTMQSYADHDASPSPGLNYYRLRQVDLDGHERLSGMRSVWIDHSGWIAELLVRPLPANGPLQVLLPASVSADRLLVLDGSGRTVLEFVLGDRNAVTIDGLAAGPYAAIAMNRGCPTAQGRIIVL